jgi:uncharacterized membrane protein
MPEISTIKSSLQTVVKKDRILNAVFAGGKSFLVSVSRTFYAFWLQATGLIYVFFTLAGIGSLYLEYHKHQLANRPRLAVLIIFTMVCATFTLQSFIRAKRTSNRK